MPSQSAPTIRDLSCELPLPVSCWNAPLPQFVSCLFCFLFLHSLFSSSDPPIKCLLQWRLTLGCVKISSHFFPNPPLSLYFCTAMAVSFLFHTSSLLDEFLPSFNTSSLLRRVVNNEIYCSNSLAYFLPFRPGPGTILLLSPRLD